LCIQRSKDMSSEFCVIGDIRNQARRCTPMMLTMNMPRTPLLHSFT
jgi:hypothetical protein